MTNTESFKVNHDKHRKLFAGGFYVFKGHAK